MNVTAEELINIETLAIKIREQRGAFLACRLEINVDEERTAGKLLHDQIARGFACCDLLSARDVFHQFCCFGWSELLETKDVEALEITLRIVSGFKDLTAQTRQHKRKRATCKDAQYLGPQYDYAVQILGELRAVEHHEGAATHGGNSLRCAKAESHERFVVVAEAQAVVRLDQLLDPFEISGRRELDELLQRQWRL